MDPVQPQQAPLDTTGTATASHHPHSLVTILLILLCIIALSGVGYMLYTKMGNPTPQTLRQTVTYVTPSPAEFENPFSTPSASYQNPFDQVATPSSATSTSGDYENPFSGM